MRTFFCARSRRAIAFPADLSNRHDMQPSKAETLCRHSEKTGGATCSVDRKWYFCACIPSPFCVPPVRKKRAKARAIGRLRSDACSCGQEKNSTKRTAPTPAGSRKIENDNWLPLRPTSKTKTKYEECNSVDLSRAILAPVCMSGQERSTSGAGVHRNNPIGRRHCASAFLRGEHSFAAKCGNTLTTSGCAAKCVCQ